MTLQKSVKPVHRCLGGGLQEVDRLNGLINFQARLFSRTSQVSYRTRIFHTHWIIVRRRRGWPRSIPVYVRRSELLWSAVNRGVA
jgi:hypothetical protein